jgi:DNA replication protein DnaC
MSDESEKRPSRYSGESMADYAKRLDDWLESPAGKASEARATALRAAEDERYAAEGRNRRSDAIGIPERYRFMGDPVRNALKTQALEAVVRNPSELIVLSGPTGCGKTAAACWWLYETPRDVPCPMFTTSPRLARMSKFDEEVMAKVLRAGRLVIDDLGIEYADANGAFVSLLDEITNERYANRLPTLITTNMDAQVLRARCGERLADRIRESGEFMSLNNPSLRKKS